MISRIISPLIAKGLKKYHYAAITHIISHHFDSVTLEHNDVRDDAFYQGRLAGRIHWHGGVCSEMKNFRSIIKAQRPVPSISRVRIDMSCPLRIPANLNFQLQLQHLARLSIDHSPDFSGQANNSKAAMLLINRGGCNEKGAVVSMSY